ncbi:Nitroreductase NfnB [subsurface metagenome]
MDILKVIRDRRSVRAFKPDPVPSEMIEQILDLTINAPSANNLQPWEFIVVAGEEKDRLSRTLIKAYKEKQISCGSGAVKPLPETYRRRGVANLELMKPYVKRIGVSVDTFINEGSCNFYGAPAAILICLDDCFSERQKVDVGTAVSYLVLAAHASGLATCPIGLIAAYEDEIKDLLNIPENKNVIIGIALGYPDLDNPVSQCKSSRERLVNLVRWIE